MRPQNWCRYDGTTAQRSGTALERAKKSKTICENSAGRSIKKLHKLQGDIMNLQDAEKSIGEWIYDKGNNRCFVIAHIGKDSVYNETKTKSCKFEKAELWKPKKDDCCWLRHLGLVFVLEAKEYSDLSEMLFTVRDTTEYQKKHEVFINRLEPFIGDLPMWIKEK